MLTRRSFMTAGLVFPAVALAHDGHDLSQISALVIDTTVGAAGIEMVLRITNWRQEDIALEAIYCSLGPVHADFPLLVAAGATLQADLSIATQEMPGIFSLVLDFGEGGMGPVTVIPS